MYKEFFYKSTIPLKPYCEENNINYNYVINRKCVLMKRNPSLSEQETIDFIVDNYKNHLIFYDGLPLKEYCDLHGINYTSMNTHIYDIMKEKCITCDAAVKFLIERYHSNRVLIYNVPLPEYCKVNDININSIYAYASRARRRLGITKEAAYILAIEQYNAKFVIFEGVPLRQYCANNGYNYNTLMSLRYKNMVREKMPKEEATIKAVEKYKRFIFMKKRIKDRAFLKENKDDSSILDSYCVANSYDIEIIRNLIELGYDFLQSIFIYQYWLDKNLQINLENFSSLVLEMEGKVKELPKSEESDIIEIIALYYAGFTDLEIIVFENVLPIIDKAVWENPYYDKQEMKQHITLLVTEKLKTNFFVSVQNLRSYMKRFVRGELIKYFYSSRDNNLSVNDEKYENKEYIDYLTDGITAEDEVMDLVENDALIEALTGILTPIQIKYVLYRFGFVDFPREPEEIKKMLKISMPNINDFETGIICKLREAPNIMKLVLK